MLPEFFNFFALNKIKSREFMKVSLKIGLQDIAIFIPFATFITSTFRTLMPFKWLTLFTVLQIISILSFCTNFIAGDFFWCMLAIGVYLILVIPVYMKFWKNNLIIDDSKCQKLVFINLFRKCARAFFSDYRLSLVSKIPLALQVLVGGSLLYGVFGADWIMHGLAGFGIGAIAMKAYTIGVNYYGYGQLASYFHLNRYRLRNERKYASAEFTVFSVTIIALLWELFENSVYWVSPVNLFRVGSEPAWNVFGDVFFAVIAGMVAWFLLYRKIKWL